MAPGHASKASASHHAWSASLEQFLVYRGWTAADQADQANGSQPLAATAALGGNDSDST